LHLGKKPKIIPKTLMKDFGQAIALCSFGNGGTFKYGRYRSN
jgi:hypothetical protein